jgi:MFS family permease
VRHERLVQAYANGMAASCFFAVQMVFTPLWSVWSNKIGRKTTLLLGLLSTALSMVLFGLSKSLGWAIVSRCICAMLNGNAPVARTMVGEMTELTGGNKGKAFSLFGFCLATGWMGAYTVRISEALGC